MDFSNFKLNELETGKCSIIGGKQGDTARMTHRYVVFLGFIIKRESIGDIGPGY